MYIALSLASLSFLICIASFMYLKTYLKRRTGQERILSEFRGEVHKILAEIDTTTERDLALIDDRVKTLEALLVHVDKRIGLLNRDAQQHKKNDELYTKLGKNILMVADENPSTSGEIHKEDASSGQTQNGKKELELSLPKRAAALSQAGFSANTIASRLGVSIAEVNMALALFGSKKT
ncbi:hypothetical protein FACS1894200_02100 [Spirochaetia bacterium]|nr:hypothetical protein FACS1894200_02100 [Spirochaetia bacterium]